MDNTTFIKGKKVCVKHTRTRIEAIQRFEPPTTLKGCRSFAGVISFLNLFYPELQKLLKPVLDLIRK